LNVVNTVYTMTK